jgi:hypothetical protein
MFDITSWIRERIFRLPKLTPSIAGEELSEKQTTKMGYFLLFCMFVAIMSTAQWTLSIIKGIPERPLAVPNCVSEVLQAFDPGNSDYNTHLNPYDSSSYYNGYNYGKYNNCTLISSYPEYNLELEFYALSVPYAQIKSYSESISRLE